MKLTYSVKTILRKDKIKADGECPLNYQIILNGKLLRLPVGVSLKAEDWDKKQACPKGKKLSRLKDKLELREAEFLEFILNCEITKRPLNFNVIKEFYKGEGKKDFYTYFDEFCKRKFKIIKKGTQAHYLLFRKQLKEYRPDLYIDDINYKFLIEYFFYLSEVKGIGNSGIGTRRKTFVCVLEEFVRMDLIKKNPCKQIKRPKEKVRDEFLTPEEIMKFTKVDLDFGTLTYGLNLTRDLFLFSCFTGLRFSDVYDLRKDQIVKGSIELIMQKTEKRIRIPLNDQALEILNKYGYRKSVKRIFPTRENVSVNRDLKIIAGLAKINKRVSFHTARHTFGSTLDLNNVRPSLIMKLMGHGDLRMTGRYLNSDKEMLDNAIKSVTFGKSLKNELHLSDVNS